jgi:CubicO group peptidase (beta-lactamase class C family)
MCLLPFCGCKKENPSVPEFDSFEEELEYLVTRYVKMGASIGVIDKHQEEKAYFFGIMSASNTSAPDMHSIYEIGSISKTFTNTLLAQKVLGGDMQLSDLVQRYLPDGEVELPNWNGIEIQIIHLATHSSGLPKRPQESSYPHPTGYNPYDPYAAYSAVHVYEYLTDYCALMFEPGTQYYYSNTAVGLLGHVLGLWDGTSYEALVSREIFEPLQMRETAITLTSGQLDHLAPGHNEYLDIVSNYHAQDIFQGAGFIKSSLHDMMIYLKAQMGLISTSFGHAIELTQQSHFDVGGVTYNDREGYYNLSIGLGWHIDELPEGFTVHHHGGRTNGYMAYMGFNKQNFTGVVILCNHSSSNVIIRFGEDLLKALNKY